MGETKPQTVKFFGQVDTWDLADPDNPRKYTVLHLTYAQFRAWTQIVPYDDRKGKGWQRQQTPSRVNQIFRAMGENEYTPTTFCGGLLLSHERSLRYYEEEGHEMVEITVHSSSKLPCTDGGHRGAALLRHLTDAQKAEDNDRAAHVLRQPVTVQVFLDHRHLQKDFMHLQDRKQVDRNQLRSMQRNCGLMDPAEAPFFDLANAVTHALNENPRSHLMGQVQFDSLTPRKIQNQSLTSRQASDYASTVFGGARIALAYGKPAEWLAEAYCQAWEALAKGGDGVPNMLKEGYMLQPSIWGGKRGATHFIVAIGNMLAWKLGWLKRNKPTAEDRALIRQVATDLFTRDSIGWSGDDKRVYARTFAASYLADCVVEQGEPATPDRDASYQGVPATLVGMLSPGAFKIDRQYLPAPDGRKKKAKDLPGRGELALEDPLDGEAPPAPKKAPTRKRALVAAGQS